MVAVVAKDQQEPQLAWFLTGGTHPESRQSTSSVIVIDSFWGSTTETLFYLDLWPLIVINFSNSSAVQVENWL
jgi:hypothetical protein